MGANITETPVGVLADRVDAGFEAVVAYAATRSGGRQVREDLETLIGHYDETGAASSQEVADRTRLLATLDVAVRQAAVRNAAAAAARTVPVISEPVMVHGSTAPHPTRQGYYMSNVVDVDGRKVRVTISRDAYDQQSRFYAEVWTGEGWQSVAHVAGDDPQGKAMPSYVCAKMADRRGDVDAATQKMHDRVLSEARAVLRNTPSPAARSVTRSEPVVVSEEPPRLNRQGYDSERIVEVDGTKVRTRVHADTSYDFQSRYTAEVWTGNGWKAACGIHPLDPQAPEMPYVGGGAAASGSPGHARAADACRVAHDRLLAQVRTLL